MKFIALFPGQGSQAVEMGRSFSESESAARDLFGEADRVLGFPLSKLCFSGPLEELTLTENAQPAILTVSVVAYTLAGVVPCAAAGHSLGEYSALVCAGALSFTDAVQLVHQRGRYMQEAVPAGTGKMVAVLGPTIEEIQHAIESVPQGIKEIANMNCPGQTVVAGDVLGVDSFARAMTRAKIIPLNVSAPFHCTLMKSAADQLARDLDRITFSTPKFPVYANASAHPAASAEEVRDLLKRQVCAPVRWTESIQNILRDTGAAHSVEFGPGGVLSNLMKRIERSVVRHEVADIESLGRTRGEIEGLET